MYTVRYAHLDTVNVEKGQQLKWGDKIGTAGNTGASDGAHLHIDCVKGKIKENWKLAQAENGYVIPDVRQLTFFIDDYLFNSPIAITTFYGDPFYFKEYEKLHLAYDVVPDNRKDWELFWNRSHTGTVLAVLDDAAYGNTVLVGFC